MNSIKLPVFFIVGKEDNLAKPTRVKSLFDKYGGEDKQFFLIDGTHQSARDPEVIQKAVVFAFRTITEYTKRMEIPKNTSQTTEGESRYL